MKTLHGKIKEASTTWYNLIGPHHHKDCDCHFRIVKAYSYGDEVTYSWEHYGYLTDHQFSRHFSTIEEAETDLLLFITEAIKDHKKLEQENPEW